jgi:cytochrome c
MGLRVLLPALALAAAAGLSPAAAETAEGAALFKRHCASCHDATGGKNRVGPHLDRLFGRKAGSEPGFNYSKAMLRMGSDGLTWDYDTLDAYIENPKALVSGTRMSFRGLADAAERDALMAFLREQSDRPSDIPESAPTIRNDIPELAPEVLAIVGDPAFGEYLSSECTTCHQRDGSDQGIPSITRWPVEDFVVAMHAYKQKLRPHPVMQMMAGRLADEEIAALAAYFASLE